MQTADNDFCRAPHPVQDLHHPAMRDRHWKMLMQTTRKHFVMDEKFCLGDLLALELHNYVDACRWVLLAHLVGTAALAS